MPFLDTVIGKNLSFWRIIKKIQISNYIKCIYTKGSFLLPCSLMWDCFYYLKRLIQFLVEVVTVEEKLIPYFFSKWNNPGCKLNETKYSRLDLVNFVEDSL